MPAGRPNMKVKFWLGTYALDPAATATRSTAEPMLSTDVSAVAIEVIEYEDSNNIAVLLSTLIDANSPEQLECRIGFANGATASNDWRDRGFPLVDAIIVREGDKLRVRSPYLRPRRQGDAVRKRHPDAHRRSVRRGRQAEQGIHHPLRPVAGCARLPVSRHVDHAKAGALGAAAHRT